MKRSFRILGVLYALLLILGLSACTSAKDMSAAAIHTTKVEKPEQPKDSQTQLKIHFIDVGQADSILIQLTDGKNVLIDGGNKGDADVIDRYLKGQGIENIDFLIATHPHEDHIGSLPFIVKNYNITSVYMPKVTANTKVFEDLLLEIKAKGLKISTASAGVKLINQEDTKLVMLAPNGTSYEEANEYSAVLKLVYKDTSFLFTGDAEAISEGEMLKKNLDLKADVLKVGHHGGRTSTTEAFLKKVSPQYAIISVGKDNDYGHPHKETMDKLKKAGIPVYKTDELGNIVVTSDGSKIMINRAPTVVEQKTAEPVNFFIGNKNSKVFHLPSCASLPKTVNQVKFQNRDAAEKAGYTPCKVCKP